MEMLVDADEKVNRANILAAAGILLGCLLVSSTPGELDADTVAALQKVLEETRFSVFKGRGSRTWEDFRAVLTKARKSPQGVC
jgi:hypothetical protein